MTSSTRSRVLLVGPLPPPRGGVSVWVESLMQSRLRSEYDIRVLDISRRRPFEQTNVLDAASVLAFLRQCLKLCWLISRLRPAVVHVMVTSSRWGLLRDGALALLAWAMGRRLILHMHGASFEREYDRASRPRQAFMRFLFERPNLMLVLGEAWRSFFSTFLPRERIRIVQTTLTVDFMRRLDGPQPTPSHNGPPVLLFVGCLGRRKGAFDLIEAMKQVHARHPAARLRLAGPPEFPRELPALRSAIAKAGLENVVEIVGECGPTDLMRELGQAQAFVLPSYEEGLPMSLLEAMAAGLPSVTTPVGAVAEVVKDGVDGLLVEPGDVDALAERLSALLGDPLLRKRLGSAARETALAEHGPDAGARTLDLVYREAIWGPAAGPVPEGEPETCVRR